jgi:hypothetical protein
VKISNVSTFNWIGAINGMRSSFQSYDKIDTFIDGTFVKLGENDLDLMKRLIKGGSSHRRFLRSIIVSYEIDAPLYWWK